MKGETQKIMRCDHGPASMCDRLRSWANDWQSDLRPIQPGQPQQNGLVEGVNQTVRFAWLARNVIEAIAPVQEEATRWLWPDNNTHPQMAIRRSYTNAKTRIRTR